MTSEIESSTFIELPLSSDPLFFQQSVWGDDDFFSDDFPLPSHEASACHQLPTVPAATPVQPQSFELPQSTMGSSCELPPTPEPSREYLHDARSDVTEPESTKEQKRTAKEEHASDVEESRSWNCQTHTSAPFHVQLKTRLKNFSSLVPKNLYGTETYKIHIETRLPDLQSCLGARVKLIDESGDEPPMKPFSKSPFLESTFHQVKDGTLHASISVKLNSQLSFQKCKTEFAFAVDIFQFGSEGSPLAELTSPCFRIYARKPNKRGGLRKTRKMTMKKESLEQKIENLFALCKKMSPEERRKCLSKCCETLSRAFDPQKGSR